MPLLELQKELPVCRRSSFPASMEEGWALQAALDPPCSLGSKLGEKALVSEVNLPAHRSAERTSLASLWTHSHRAGGTAC